MKKNKRKLLLSMLLPLSGIALVTGIVSCASPQTVSAINNEFNKLSDSLESEKNTKLDLIEKSSLSTESKTEYKNFINNTFYNEYKKLLSSNFKHQATECAEPQFKKDLDDLLRQITFNIEQKSLQLMTKLSNDPNLNTFLNSLTTSINILDKTEKDKDGKIIKTEGILTNFVSGISQARKFSDVNYLNSFNKVNVNIEKIRIMFNEYIADLKAEANSKIEAINKSTVTTTLKDELNKFINNFFLPLYSSVQQDLFEQAVNCPEAEFTAAAITKLASVKKAVDAAYANVWAGTADATKKAFENELSTPATFTDKLTYNADKTVIETTTGALTTLFACIAGNRGFANVTYAKILAKL